MKLSAAASAGASTGPVGAVQTRPSTFADEPVPDLNELVSLLDFEGAAQRRRSLMPAIAGHMVMDMLIEPWLILSAATGVMTSSHR